MKKKYINPTTEVIKIESHKIMAGSPGLNGGEYPGGTILSREDNFLFEE